MRSKKQKPYARPIVRSIASRAVFNEASGQLPMINMEFEMPDGEKVVFELTVEQAARHIEQAVAAYHAIVPNLKIGRSPFVG